MADPMIAVGSALYAFLGTAGTVPVYDSLAPQQDGVGVGGTPPYCIFQYQAGNDVYAFGGSSGLDADFVVKVVSNRRWPGEAITIYGNIHTALQDAPLTVTGYGLLRCRRSSPVKFRDQDGYWHVGGIYRVDVNT